MLKTADGGNPDVVDKSIRRTPGRQTSRAGQSGPEKGEFPGDAAVSTAV